MYWRWNKVAKRSGITNEHLWLKEFRLKYLCYIILQFFFREYEPRDSLEILTAFIAIYLDH